jgi:hypothetical protein
LQGNFLEGQIPEVDMKFTKTFGRARLKVAALAPERIPELVNVVIGDYVFGLQFLVETEEESKNPSPIYLDEHPKDEDNKEQEKKMLRRKVMENQRRWPTLIKLHCRRLLRLPGVLLCRSRLLPRRRWAVIRLQPSWVQLRSRRANLLKPGVWQASQR